MVKTDLANAVSSNMANAVADVTISPKNTDGVGSQDETIWSNTKWSQYWGYFNELPDLKAAIIMKSIWTCGKGYITDAETEVILSHISGMGKDTFLDILLNMEIVKSIGGDAFAEIIRDSETGTLINLKPLDPGRINIVIDKKGILKRYEQIRMNPDTKKASVIHVFKPEEILHFSNNRLADQIHGISDIEAMEKTILAENESFTDIKKLMHHQVKPFILWKLKTDDPVKISALVTKIDNARNLGEDMFIPDDDEAISYEVVQLNLSQAIFEWRNDVRNKFYRALGMPLIIFGQAGTTESGGKIEYLAHEQVFERNQKYVELQIWNQLQLRINLLPPTSLLDNLQTDQNKDANQGMEIQPSDLTAGAG